MAYQPIEMGARPPMLDALDQLNQSIGSIGDQRDHQRKQKDLRDQQEHVDYQNAMTAAQKHFAAGDYEGGVAFLAPYRGRVIADHQAALSGGAAEPQAPVSPQGLPPGTPPGAGKIPPAPQMGAPQGGSPMPDALEQQDKFAPPPDRFGGQAPAEGGPQPAPALPDHPLFAAQAATKARDQQKARTLVAFTPPGGQEQTFDPEAGPDRRHAQRLAQMDEAFAGSKDPLVQKYYPQIRAAVAGSDEDIKPMDALRYMHYMSATEQTGVNTHDRIDASNTNQDKNRGERERGFDVSMRNADVAAAARRAQSFSFNNNPLKVDTGTRGDAGALEKAVKDAWTEANGKALLTSDRTLNAIFNNVSAEGPDAVTAHKDAFIGLAKLFRGGTPTDAEQELLLKHLGGMKGALQQFYADADSGDFSDITKQNLARATKLSLEEQGKNVARFTRFVGRRLGPESEFAGMGVNVNNAVKSIGDLYGLDLPDVTPNQGHAVLGSGRKAAQAPQAKPKSKAGSNADEELAWAHAHIDSTAPVQGGLLEKDVAADIMKKRGAK